MANEVKLYGHKGSTYDCEVKIVLKLKGIKYEFFQEDFENKSADLLKYNPVHKKIPVLVHNGKPIAESLVIIQYIDEVWKEVPLLPQDVYDKAQARFWAKFLDDTCIPALFKAIGGHGKEQEVAIVEARAQLEFLENELNVKGSKFFGGDNINIVDIAASYISFWLGAAEEAVGIKVLDDKKFPKLTEWASNYINCQAVKDFIPPKEVIVAFYKKRFGYA